MPFKSVLAVGTIAGVIRALVFCLGAYLLSQTADWRQPLGYGLALVGLPEVVMMRGLRDQPFVWAMVSSIMLVVSTVGWVAGFAWVISGSRRSKT